MFTGTYTLVTGNYPQLKDMCKVIFVSFAVLFCTGNTLYSQSTVDRYDNPDITSIYSTHPERPFRYGYPYERDEIIELFEDGFKAYEISAGDNVAEIGAASGWLTAAFSVLSDSVTYYIQDIDTNLLNQTQFDAVIKHFSEQRLTKQTNNFHFVVGSETSTNLPEELFDIIIINNSFHEFSETSSMMDDIVKKLKPRGRLVIHESFANDDMKVHHSGCNIKAYKVSEVEELLAPSGLYLTKMEYPRSSTINYLTFETNVIKSEKYLDGLIEIEPLFTNLKVLNSKRICSSRKKMSLVLNNLEVDFEKIIEYFPSMRPYFFSLADEYQKLNKHKCAVQVLETCVRLYPDDPASRILLADAYYLLYRDDLAIDCYQYVANLDSTNTSVRADLIMSYIRIKSFDNAFHEYQMALMIDKPSLCAY